MFTHTIQYLFLLSPQVTFSPLSIKGSCNASMFSLRNTNALSKYILVLLNMLRLPDGLAGERYALLAAWRTARESTRRTLCSPRASTAR